jgi:hypothetical protein
VLDLAGDDLAAHVGGLGDDPFGGDADDQGDAQTVGQAVVGPDPPAAAGALAGVGQQAGLGQPLHALGDCRLGDAGTGGDLGSGEPVLLDQGAQHVLVGQRAEQFQ